MPRSWTVLAAFLIILTCAAAIFLVTASYARKETARGILRTASGDERVMARARGVVRKLLVSEGEWVDRGAPLLVVSTAQTLESGQIADDEILMALTREEATLRERLAAQATSATFDRDVLAAQIDGLIAERRAARSLIASSAARLRIAEERLALGQKLDAQGFIAGDEMRRREEAVIIQRQAGDDATARTRVLSARIAEAEARRAQQPHVAAIERGEIEASLAVLVQRRTHLEAQRSYALRAHVGGRVTALQAAVGQQVDSLHPLMTITPVSAPLTAEIYAPSRARGFIRKGQRVRLRYDAFPYQRFGAAFGIVEAVSDSVLRPSDVQVPVQLEEPAYRVVVRLDRTTVEAFGRSMPLQPGMALTADIILERRNFAEWLFAPLLAARGGL